MRRTAKTNPIQVFTSPIHCDVGRCLNSLEIMSVGHRCYLRLLICRFRYRKLRYNVAQHHGPLFGHFKLCCLPYMWVRYFLSRIPDSRNDVVCRQEFVKCFRIYKALIEIIYL